MGDSSQDNAGPFTMVYHLLAQEVGLVCAAVYGEVRRRCQMEKGICNASLDTLGSAINLDRATVMRSIKKLCESGYLTDQTPGRRNAPHTYILSKSVAQCNTLEDTSVIMRSDSEAETVAEKNKTVAHNNSSTESVAERNVTVAESHLNRVLEEKTPNGVGKELPSKQKIEDTDKTTPLWQLMNEFTKQTGIPMAVNASRKKDWWTAIREIYELANRDVDVGKRLIRDAIEEARQNNWTVTRPGSLVNTAGKLMAKPTTLKVTAL